MGFCRHVNNSLFLYAREDAEDSAPIQKYETEFVNRRRAEEINSSRGEQWSSGAPVWGEMTERPNEINVSIR
jgi:hypothetical protein